MHAILLLAVFVCAFARYDPGYPAVAPSPQNYDQNLKLKYGAAFGVNRINGDANYSYYVSNQPGRNTKFQVYVFNQTNFDRYNAGGNAYCMNPESCSKIVTTPVQGGFTFRFAQNQAVWLVVQNRNFLDDGNVRVAFRSTGGSSSTGPFTSGTSGFTSFNSGFVQTNHAEGGNGHH